MSGSLATILLLILAVWLWLDSLRAKEQAVGICARACDEHLVQLLDQTVTLHRLGLRWGPEGIRLRRIYRFDYSEDGTGRHTGHLVLVGSRLEELSMGLLSC
ncbi:MAG TPA: DUF3301 domain-containing protein [Sedimenticola sp.]|nr:DUF3301 domain-containing protein [Sedimenticola sp.]